ncbi:AEC family transporter [Magnetovibrio sp. PR-2]|uniref:AEC family transporter n=1 Tax=Magnetovibrio sp. PR-2 TaxID=3120356 RepID=UPI002FCE138F
MFETLIAIVAPVLISAAIGYAWAHYGKPYNTEMVTHLVTVVGVPCLVFTTLVHVEIELDALAQMAGATFAALGIMAGVGYGFLKLKGWSVQAFLPALIFPNTGNMGLPLSLLAFGETGMALAVAYFTVCIIFQFTVGVAVSTGTMSLVSLLRVPTLYAIIMALSFKVSNTAVPDWAANTIEILSGFTIPLMLITLGISLQQLKVREMGKSLTVALMRMAMGFGVALFIAEVMGFEGAMKGILILQSTLPVAVFNYLFAARYDTEPGAVAGSVVLSTVISFATLPLLMWFVL